jgi:hypothetical protein
MPGAVQRLDHRLELLHLALRLSPAWQLARECRAARVAVVRGEEGDRVVAPVVAQAALDEVVVVDELVHRHQLDGRDAEAAQVLDDRRWAMPAYVPRISAGTPGGVGQALDVGLVDDRVVHPGDPAAVVAPVEERVAGRRPGHVRRAVGGFLLVRGRRSRRRSTPGPSRPRRRSHLAYGSSSSLDGLHHSPVRRMARAPGIRSAGGADVRGGGVPAVAVDLGRAGRRISVAAVGPPGRHSSDAFGDAGEQREVRCPSRRTSRRAGRPADPPRGAVGAGRRARAIRALCRRPACADAVPLRGRGVPAPRL